MNLVKFEAIRPVQKNLSIEVDPSPKEIKVLTTQKCTIKPFYYIFIGLPRFRVVSVEPNSSKAGGLKEHLKEK